MSPKDVRRTAKEAIASTHGKVKNPSIVMNIIDNPGCVSFVRIGAKRYRILSLASAPAGKVYVLDRETTLRALKQERDTIRRLTSQQNQTIVELRQCSPSPD